MRTNAALARIGTAIGITETSPQPIRLTSRLGLIIR